MECTNLKRAIKLMGKNIRGVFKKKSIQSEEQQDSASQKNMFTNNSYSGSSNDSGAATLSEEQKLRQYYNAPIILDCGTGSIKAGFSIDKDPCCIVPTILGTPRKGLFSGTTRRRLYVGESTRQMRGILTYNYPMDRGIVIDWNAMEQIIHYCFEQELGIEPSEHPILFTEIPNNPNKHREHLTQLMFERYNVPAMCLAKHAVLSLYSIGQITGLSVDSGEGITNIVPVFEGNVIKEAIQTMHLAGKDLNEYLLTLINSRGNFLSSTAEKELVREIKETLCYVSEHLADELILYGSNHALETSFQLPDGNIISLGSECVRCPEPLFDPNILGHNFGGIHTHIDECLKLCKGAHVPEMLLKQIILSGGNTLFRGIDKRLLKELRLLLPGKQINIVAGQERNFNVWKGGAALAQLPNFKEMCITEQEYNESGPAMVFKKFH